MKHLNHRGFTMVEVLIASVLGVSILGLVIFGTSRIFSDTTALSADHETESELYELLGEILKAGRTSDSCAKVEVTALTATVGNPQSMSITCDVKAFSNLPATKLRFRKINSENTIKYETSDDGIAWTLKRTYGGADKFPVSSFKVCKFSDITPLVPICTIPNTGIGRVLNVSGFKSRYFRFYFKATHPKNGREYELQSAFYVRNPPPSPDISYLWSSN